MTGHRAAETAQARRHTRRYGDIRAAPVVAAQVGGARIKAWPAGQRLRSGRLMPSPAQDQSITTGTGAEALPLATTDKVLGPVGIPFGSTKDNVPGMPGVTDMLEKPKLRA